MKFHVHTNQPESPLRGNRQMLAVAAVGSDRGETDTWLPFRGEGIRLRSGWMGAVLRGDLKPPVGFLLHLIAASANGPRLVMGA